MVSLLEARTMSSRLCLGSLSEESSLAHRFHSAFFTSDNLGVLKRLMAAYFKALKSLLRGNALMKANTG